jgi:hypothetical protein
LRCWITGWVPFSARWIWVHSFGVPRLNSDSATHTYILLPLHLFSLPSFDYMKDLFSCSRSRFAVLGRLLYSWSDSVLGYLVAFTLRHLARFSPALARAGGYAYLPALIRRRWHALGGWEVLIHFLSSGFILVGSLGPGSAFVLRFGYRADRVLSWFCCCCVTFFVRWLDCS